jgi:Trk K+ transport system NAD-binding subunit
MSMISAREPEFEPAESSLAVLHAGGGHVIVCGLSNLGLRIAEQLHEAAVPCVIVDDGGAEAAWKQIKRWNIPVVRESSTSIASLMQAGIMQAGAVIAAHDEDLTNLETALLVTDLEERESEVHVVVRLANARLAEQLSTALPAAVVLSLPEKAGSSFVEGCVQSSLVHAFAFAEQRMEVVDIPIKNADHSTIRQAFGDLTPVALRPADGGPLVVCPGRDYELAVGDQITLLGRPEDFRAVGRLVREEEEAEALIALHGGELSLRADAPEQSLLKKAQNWVQAFGRAADRPVRIMAVTVIGIIVFSTILLRLTYHNHTVVGADGKPLAFGWLQALYFTSTIVATVGFGDYSFATEPGWLTAYGIFLIFVGAAAVATLYALVTNFIVTSRLEQAFGQQRAIRMRDHVIVVGLGAMGIRVVEGLLSVGRQAVIIERDPAGRYLARARALGVPVVMGDATTRAVLMQAGLSHATALAAMTSSDLANVETALVARSEAADDEARKVPLRVVVRVFDTSLADQVERRFSIHAVRSTSALAAPWFLGAALGYDVLSTFYTERQPFLVARLTVAPGAALDGVLLSDLTPQVRVVAVVSGGQIVPRPTRFTVLKSGEQLLLVGPPREVIATFRANQQAAVSVQV